MHGFPVSCHDLEPATPTHPTHGSEERAREEKAERLALEQVGWWPWQARKWDLKKKVVSCVVILDDLEYFLVILADVPGFLSHMTISIKKVTFLCHGGRHAGCALASPTLLTAASRDGRGIATILREVCEADLNSTNVFFGIFANILLKTSFKNKSCICQ